MPKGGARLNSGPPPDPNALRRDRPSDKDGWRTLPESGRDGDTPPWPLPADIRLSAALDVATREQEIISAQLDAGDAPRGAVAKLAKLDQLIAELHRQLEVLADMERELWEALWRTPQSVAWEEHKWTREVALYVRWQVLAELGDLKAGQEARQWSDRLGLNPTAMLRNRWRIGPPQPAAPKSSTPARARSSSVKERMKGLTVIEGGGAKGTRKS